MNFDTLKTIVVVIVAGAAVWWGAILLGRFLSWIERSEIARQKAEAAAKQSLKAQASAAAFKSDPGGIPAAHVAAIAAAVGAIGGAHKIVHISVAGAASVWAAEGRWMHQTSHRPH